MATLEDFAWVFLEVHSFKSDRDINSDAETPAYEPDYSGILSAEALQIFLGAVQSFSFGCYADAASMLEKIVSDRNLSLTESGSQTEIVLASYLAMSMMRAGAYKQAIHLATTKREDASFLGQVASLGVHALALAERHNSYHHPFIISDTDKIRSDSARTAMDLIRGMRDVNGAMENETDAIKVKYQDFLGHCEDRLLNVYGNVADPNKESKRIFPNPNTQEVPPDVTVLEWQRDGIWEKRKPDLEASELESQRMLKATVQALGASHSRSVLERRRLGYAQIEMGKITQAIETMEAAWRYCLERFPYDQFSIEMECDVAQSLLEGRRFMPAITRATSVIKALESKFDRHENSQISNPDSQSCFTDDLVARARSIKASAHWAMGQKDQAIEDSKLAAKLYLNRYADETIEYKLVEAHCIAFQSSIEDPDAAIDKLDHICFSCDVELGPAYLWFRIRVLELLAAINFEIGDLVLYTNAVRAQLMGYERLLEEDHPVRRMKKAECLLHTLLYDARGNLDVDGILADLLDIAVALSDRPGPEDIMTLSAYFYLARAYMETEKHLDQAVELLQYVENMRFVIFGRSHPDTVAARDALQDTLKLIELFEQQVEPVQVMDIDKGEDN